MQVSTPDQMNAVRYQDLKQHHIDAIENQLRKWGSIARYSISHFDSDLAKEIIGLYRDAGWVLTVKEPDDNNHQYNYDIKFNNIIDTVK